MISSILSHADGFRLLLCIKQNTDAKERGRKVPQQKLRGEGRLKMGRIEIRLTPSPEKSGKTGNILEKRDGERGRAKEGEPLQRSDKSNLSHVVNLAAATRERIPLKAE